MHVWLAGCLYEENRVGSVQKSVRKEWQQNNVAENKTTNKVVFREASQGCWVTGFRVQGSARHPEPLHVNNYAILLQE